MREKTIAISCCRPKKYYLRSIENNNSKNKQVSYSQNNLSPYQFQKQYTGTIINASVELYHNTNAAAKFD